MPQDPNKIHPRKSIESRCPSKREVLEGLRDDPRYIKLDERHWRAIYAEWDICAETGKKATMKEVANKTGVSVNTIQNWRTRRDFLEAQREVSWQILNEWIPILATKALNEAAVGKDKKALMFFLDRIFPQVKDADSSGSEVGTQVIVWGEQKPEPDPFPALDTESREDKEKTKH